MPWAVGKVYLQDSLDMSLLCLWNSLVRRDLAEFFFPWKPFLPCRQCTSAAAFYVFSHRYSIWLKFCLHWSLVSEYKVYLLSLHVIHAYHLLFIPLWDFSFKSPKFFLWVQHFNAAFAGKSVFESYFISPVNFISLCKWATFSSFETERFPKIPLSVLENASHYTKLSHPICFHTNGTIITFLRGFVSLSNNFLAHFILAHGHS